MENKIKIFVTYKDKHKIIETDIIKPIQTGRAIADEIFDGMIGDDTGDNISSKNPRYNELSAQYWVWKHYEEIGDPEYIGFMHYRRHFLFDESKQKPNEKWLENSFAYKYDTITEDYMEFLKSASIEDAIKESDIIVPKIYDYSSTSISNLKKDWSFLPQQKMEHFYLLFDIIKQIFPEYSEIAESVKNGHVKYLCNMFIMKKSIFNEYCNFLYPILSKMDESVDSSMFSAQASRFLGYCGELILTIFLLKKKSEKLFRIKELDISYIENADDDYIFSKDIFDNSYSIGVSSSNEYVPYLSVWLVSLMKFADDNKQYNIFVFNRSITPENKDILKNMLSNKKNLHIYFVNPLNCLKHVNLKYHSHYNLECYFRLCAPLILYNCHKLLFTDADLIFNKDPALLIDTDVTGYPLASCRDFVYGAMYNCTFADWVSYSKDILHLEKPYDYVNTGVMLLNVECFNKNNYSEKIIDFVNKNYFRILEQDGINSYFQSKIKFIDTAWNFTVDTKTIDVVMKYMPMVYRKQFELDRQNPYIIHWAGKDKPWNIPTEKMANIWWSYAKESPFYEELFASMINYKIKTENKHFYNIVSSYKKNVLSYWKCKLLRNLTFGRKRKHYIEKKKRLKAKIRQVKDLQKI